MKTALRALNPILIAGIFLAQPADAGAIRTWWTNWCEQHLSGEDPYQYESFSVDQLIQIYWEHRRERFHSKALMGEIQNRLNRQLSYTERELLTKTLANNAGEKHVQYK